MRECKTTHAIIAALLAFFVTADVSAQILFAGDNNGLSVNGRIIDTGNLHESLLNVVEILSVIDESFAAYIPADFPMRARINGVMYEVWRDRIVESCDTRKVDHEVQVQIRPDPFVISVPFRRRKEASGDQMGTPLLISSFKGDGQQADLFVNYGIPLEPIYDRSEGMTVENVSISTGLVNDQGDTLVERTRHFDHSTNQVKAFPDQDLWVDTQQMQVPSDEHDLMVVQKTDGKTVDVQRREIRVPGYDQAGLRISDVMLAYSVEETESGIPANANEIVRNGFSIMPAPRNVYSTEWPIYLYFEWVTLGARGRTDYDVEIALDPKNADRTPFGL